MREQVQNSTRRLAELRARREHVMSLLPDDARRRIRHAMSLRQRFTLNHPRYQVEDHEDRNGDPRAESSRNQPMTNRHGEDGVPPIVVEDVSVNPVEMFTADPGHSSTTLFTSPTRVSFF